MAEHPIQGLMTTAMESIKDMVDVNTIVGDAVQAPDGTIIIPISKVTFGFAAGGGEYNSCCKVMIEGEDGNNKEVEAEGSGKHSFAGGSGAGVSINPVAFMVAVKLKVVVVERFTVVGSSTAALTNNETGVQL